MKESLPLTSKDLVQAFLKTHNNTYNLTEAKDGVYLAELADICLKHGMKKHSCILRLMESVVNWDVTVLFGLDKERTTEQIKLGKDLATLTNIFKNGRSIKIQAFIPNDTNPNGGIKKKHISIDIENDGLIQKLAFLSFNSYLARIGSYYEFWHVAETPNNLNQGTFPEYLISESGSFFKEPYSDDALADIIEFDTSDLDFDKALKGRTARTKTEVPKLGLIACDLIRAGEQDLESMKPTEKHCLVFDLMQATGIAPDEVELRGMELKNKEKADMVKSWVRSFKKVIKEREHFIGRFI